MGSRVLENPHRELDVSYGFGWWLDDFHFLSKEDMAIIEKRYWVIGSGSLILKHWHVGFDPQFKVMVKRNLWVLLWAFLFIVGTLRGSWG